MIELTEEQRERAARVIRYSSSGGTFNSNKDQVSDSWLDIIDAVLDAINTEPEPTLLEEVMRSQTDAIKGQTDKTVDELNLIVARAAIECLREGAEERLKANELITYSLTSSQTKVLLNTILGEPNPSSTINR